jgi:pimeloyl-ACP methyl ester carboxylesterase
MMLDPQPSIYLNRPCYGLDVMPANCTANLWTGGRYSSTIADTMQTALDNLRQSFPGKRWLLIGHSGGGSLAMLIAQGRNDVAGVITLAANLDTEAWMRNRFSLPLDQSLNPVLMPPLQAQIPRWHFATEDDAQVPAPLIAEAAKRDEYARFILLQGDHDCCWQEHWPRIPQEMAAQLKEPE